MEFSFGTYISRYISNLHKIKTATLQKKLVEIGAEQANNVSEVEVSGLIAGGLPLIQAWKLVKS